MGREHLKSRANWQAASAISGSEAERAFDAIMRLYCLGTEFMYVSKPRDLREIYGTSHGIVPEAVIRNTRTERAVYVEVKRQGDRGNAHERACKYFAPGIVASTRVIANQPEGVIPFWWIFTNGIARAPRYVEEIRHWFQGIQCNLLLWENIRDYEPVVDHFERCIKPMLD